MLFEEALILVGIPLLLAVAGVVAWRAELTVIGGIGLLVAGVMMLASPLVVQYGVTSGAELIHSWNCTGNDGCFGTVATSSCDGLDAQVDCEAINGCEWNGGCTGTPTDSCPAIYDTGGMEYCVNVTGCNMWNMTTPHECASYETDFEYDGEELPFYNNLMLGSLITLFGLLCMVVGSVSLRD